MNRRKLGSMHIRFHVDGKKVAADALGIMTETQTTAEKLGAAAKHVEMLRAAAVEASLATDAAEAAEKRAQIAVRDAEQVLADLVESFQ